ncbi:ROK family protein [Sutcliffiella rhizosphaerae]|uniref:Glucokinase n=1 Tax=Sutcliffiella rhizosphaerae TaxID=2880967 RepID=A0ABM8YME8_9BACI|nr:ROK family protein [Sutcliffiella rhizosphaerae]CAG9621144.1 Glucokinase [Sutcliffiella rhizosphaerae]
MEYSIGVDIGGTKIAAGVVKTDGEVVFKKIVETPRIGRKEILQVLRNILEELMAWANDNGIILKSIGIGTAGQVDYNHGIVLSGTTNIQDWNNIPLRQTIMEYTDLPVFLDNDVNVLTISEHLFGAAKGYGNVICLALGTGVGGGVLVNGTLLRGEWGGAAELGHTSLNIYGELCNCGMRGCLETYASGTWIAKRMQRLYVSQGKHNDRISAQDVFRLYMEGNPNAAEVIQLMTKGLSYGIVNFIHTFNPQLILLGGGVMTDGHWIIPLLQKEINKIGLQSLVSHVEIKQSQLSANSGLIGAAMLKESI